ncbi:MAG: glycosyltransferase [Acidiferrobacterales bacterium]
MVTSPPVIGLTLNFRDAARTHDCVQSLLADGACHVLVWDNSEDSGASAVALRTALGAEKRVSIAISPANLGFAAGVNRGIDWIVQQHRGAWILLINNDAYLLPGALVALRDALTHSTAARFAYPDIDQGGQVTGTVYYQRWFGLLLKHPLPGCDAHASGCCLLLDPERTGSTIFDEDFFMYGEDAELGCRMSRLPGALLHVPGTWVRHKGPVSGRRGSPFYEGRMVAAHLILARKLARNPVAATGMLLGRALMLPTRALVRALRQHSTIPLRALAQGWRLARGQDPLLKKAQSVATQRTNQG